MRAPRLGVLLSREKPREAELSSVVHRKIVEPVHDNVQDNLLCALFFVGACPQGPAVGTIATMAATKKKSTLGDELKAERRERLESITFRADAETRALLEALAEKHDSGLGAVLRVAIRRLAREEGLLSE